MDDSIIKLEKSIDLNKFMYNGENIWPVFRNILALTVQGKDTGGKKVSFFTKLKNIVLVVSSIKYFFLLKNLFFNKYDYIFFTCAEAYGKKQCMTKHRLFGCLYDQLATRKILEIQLGSSIVTCDETRKYFSYDLLSFFKVVLARFIFVGDVSIIESEIKQIDVSLNVRKIIKKYIANNIIDRLIFRIIRPKKVFVDSNSFWSTIKVANESDISTFEFQHGVVVNHTYYNVEFDINNSFYPQYFITFGQIECEYLQNKSFSKNIISVGNMLIDSYYDTKNLEIERLKTIFKYVVCVSLQNSVLESVVNYILHQAALFNDICFILIPRYEHDLDSYDFSALQNIKVFLKMHTYEIITNSDYHLTCYSTCAQEAPSLGVQNIFINFYNASIIYFEEFIHNYSFNYCIEPSSDLSIIYTIPRLNKAVVRNMNKKNISIGYKSNIKHFIDTFRL
jgi:hypothetical protein